MGREQAQWLHRRGALARDGWESVVDGSVPGWEYGGLRVGELRGDATLALPAAGEERLIVPLAGSFDVRYDDAGGTHDVHLAGRRGVFDGPTDVLYLGTGVAAVLSGTGRVAVASAATDAPHPSRRVPAEDIPVELRGAGSSSRQVHNFGTPEALDAGRLIVCEVITPAGNWSSYPPHKHDEERPGQESRLSEIYYFEAAPVSGSSAGGAAADAAFGVFRAYSSSAGRIEIDDAVRSGDIALVPHGYHGPAAAAPGYDLYYLNVMAGDGAERAWLITDDPDHAWVRTTWTHESIDPRLPYRDAASEEGR